MKRFFFTVAAIALTFQFSIFCEEDCHSQAGDSQPKKLFQFSIFCEEDCHVEGQKKVDQKTGFNSQSSVRKIVTPMCSR